MAYANTASTVSLQKIVKLALARGDIEPVLNTVQFDINVPLAIANDTMNDICSVDFPWKWNEIIIPPFYTNQYQQDYSGTNPLGVASVTNLSWLSRGLAVDINSDSTPKPSREVEVGRQLPQSTGSFYGGSNTGCNPLFFCNFFPNQSLYYGTWGDADTGNGTWGNNPQAGSLYVNPLGSNMTMPANPITQIQDANGNFLTLIQYGVEGSTAPLAPPNATPGDQYAGAGASTLWAVTDPNGMGFRLLPVPSSGSTVWQINLVGQALPVRFTTLQQTLAPLPDQYEPNFRQIFIARCYQYSPKAEIRAKFAVEHQLAMTALQNCRVKSDREQEENRFVPERTIMGCGYNRTRGFGPQNPYFPS